MTENIRRVLVEAPHERGTWVLAGTFVDSSVLPNGFKTVILKDCRCAVRYTPTSGALLGLAEDGPANDCRIGPLVKGPVEVSGVRLMVDVTERAWAQWEKKPWS